MDLNDYYKEISLNIESNNFWSKAIDQKITFDVLSFISQCILELPEKDFRRKNIEESVFFDNGLQRIYGKPPAKQIPREVDKFISQPLNFLESTGILGLAKNTSTRLKTFHVRNPEILAEIADSDSKSLEFLVAAFLKIASHLPFEKDLISFVKNKNGKRDELYDLRHKFTEYIQKNTGIKTAIEPPRKFNKLIQVLAYYYKGTGSKSGSPNPIYLADITYNRANFRDKKKDKNVSREKAKTYINSARYAYDLDRHKREIRKEKISGIARFMKSGKATPEVFSIMKKMHERDEMGIHVHHIFSDSSFPELSDVKENLIFLNANEHLQYAHPLGNTSMLDKDFQKICLMAKLNEIEEDQKRPFPKYDHREFVNVLNIGFSTNIFSEDDDIKNLESKMHSFLFRKEENNNKSYTLQ